MKIWVVKIHADIDCNDRKGLKCIERVILKGSTGSF
jgi:hypothetical protein